MLASFLGFIVEMEVYGEEMEVLYLILPSPAGEAASLYKIFTYCVCNFEFSAHHPMISIK